MQLSRMTCPEPRWHPVHPSDVTPPASWQELDSCHVGWLCTYLCPENWNQTLGPAWCLVSATLRTHLLHRLLRAVRSCHLLLQGHFYVDSCIQRCHWRRSKSFTEVQFTRGLSQPHRCQWFWCIRGVVFAYLSPESLHVRHPISKIPHI